MRTTRPGPFGVVIRDLVGRPGEMRETERDVVLTRRWGEGLISVAAGTGVHVEARLESVHEGILVTGSARTDAVGQCSRCLDDIVRHVEVEFQDLFAYPGSGAGDFEVQDDHVDLETEVKDAIVLSLPFQPVCRPDCPGLDPVTGERRADMPDATARRLADPRWAVLAGLASDPADGADPSALQPPTA